MLAFYACALLNRIDCAVLLKSFHDSTQIRPKDKENGTPYYSRSEFANTSITLFFERFLSVSHNQKYLAVTTKLHRSDIHYYD